jgi:hypothetical protein
MKSSDADLQTLGGRQFSGRRSEAFNQVDDDMTGIARPCANQPRAVLARSDKGSIVETKPHVG